MGESDHLEQTTLRAPGLGGQSSQLLPDKSGGDIAGIPIA